MILLLAGLQGIPRELEEAAAIDGASRRQAIRYVTLPLLGPTIRVSVFLSIIGALQLFDLVWVTTRGGPVNASNTMAVYMFDWGFVRFQFGYGSAVAVILFVICFVVALAYQRWVLRRDTEGATDRMAEPTAGRRRRRRSRPGRPRRALGVRRSRGLRPLRYVLAARRSPRSSSCRSLYAVLGGFRDAPPARGRPGRPAGPVGRRPTTPTSLTSASVLAPAPQQRRRRRPDRPVVVVLFAALAAFVFARREFPGREVAYTLFTLGLLFPVGGRDPAAAHPRPRPRAARQPARARPAAGGVRAAADDHHPAAVLPEHPDGARGRRRDRRLRPARLLLADPAAAVASRPWSPSPCWPSSSAGTSSCCRW